MVLLHADDPKYQKTVMAVKNALFYNGLVYRYINHDDFGKPTFIIYNMYLLVNSGSFQNRNEGGCKKYF